MSKKIKSENKMDEHENSPYKPKKLPKNLRKKPIKLLSDRSGPYSLT